MLSINESTFNFLNLPELRIRFSSSVYSLGAVNKFLWVMALSKIFLGNACNAFSIAAFISTLLLGTQLSSLPKRLLINSRLPITCSGLSIKYLLILTGVKAEMVLSINFTYAFSSNSFSAVFTQSA